MQNWEAMQPTANYDQHNSWYNNNMFAATIKTEPGTTSPTQQHLGSPPLQTPVTTPHSATTQLENYLKQQMAAASASMDTMAAMTPSPSNNECNMQHFFDSNMQQQMFQQQQYQQQFQQAQQVAAQNQHASAHHMPLVFNPLTPPGLPTAVLPSMTHFYQQNNMRVPGQQTPSPQPSIATAFVSHNNTPMDANEKLQSALTPRNTPPIDVTPPKSPKSGAAESVAMLAIPQIEMQMEKDQDVMSNSSEDMKYMIESEDDDTIRLPIYNSHGKMKNYKCKTCGQVAITKVAFWEHTKTHMKPEKMLQCPKCPFVTELKHHLEYHTRKHKNIKPFQCDKCSYSCVNKSMLNSHRKSHSSVYQYRCSDCDYVTKYCHSLKLHLRNKGHKPGMVLDEQGIPNPSIVIDVYGTRRGPKTKSAAGGSGTKRERQQSAANMAHQSNVELKLPTSQLSAALQGFPMNTTAQQHPMPASPAKSTGSNISDLPSLTLNMSLQQQHQKQQQELQQQQQNASQAQSSNAQNAAQQSMSNLLPPLASILQQNHHNMASFFPYWNLNLQMLAAQQQAAVLAQLSPSMRETALQHLQNPQSEKNGSDSEAENDDDEDVDNNDQFDRKSVDSAMDLSQGTPTKEEQPQQETPEVAMNLKLQEEPVDTPLISTASSSRRKGRVLKLDTLLQTKSASQSPEEIKHTKSAPHHCNEMPKASSPISAAPPAIPAKVDEYSSADESMETAAVPAIGTTTAAAGATTTTGNNNAANTSGSSTASSSGNSSNGSSSSNSSSGGSGPAANGAIYECKYCDIYFKDAVLYTIHMGYHSCDDVFKCNMCGEKCDGPVGLFVHMARNAHS